MAFDSTGLTTILLACIAITNPATPALVYRLLDRAG